MPAVALQYKNNQLRANRNFVKQDTISGITKPLSRLTPLPRPPFRRKLPAKPHGRTTP